MTAEILGVDPIRPGGANTLQELQAWASEPDFVSDMEARVRAVMSNDSYLVGIENPYSVAEQVRERILAGEVEQYDLRGNLLYVVTYRRSGIKAWTNIYWPDEGIPGVNDYAWWTMVESKVNGERVHLYWAIIAPCGNDAPLGVSYLEETDQGTGSIVILIRYYRQQYEIDLSYDFDIDS